MRSQPRSTGSLNRRTTTNCMVFAMLVMLLAPCAMSQDESFFEPMTKPAIEREYARGGYELGADWHEAARSTSDIRQSPARREWLLDEIGRYAPKSIAEEIRGTLKDESPAIRIATMRALMRMGVGRAHDDLSGILAGEETEPKEAAWAARALGHSEDPKAAVTVLIRSLNHHSPGVRASAAASLRKLTGLTQGTPSTYFLPGTEQSELETVTKGWTSWWDKNKDKEPSEWRLSALKSELPRERGAAARAIASSGEMEAIPALIDALEKEGREGGASGVRESITQALEKLTGRRINYKPFVTKGMTAEEWDNQHRAAIKSLRDFSDRLRTAPDEASRLAIGLTAPEPASRGNALRLLKKLPRESQPIERYAEMLSDPSTGVAAQAWQNLVDATGVSWPFEPTAGERTKRIQIARWKEWTAIFGTSLQQAAVTPFLDASAMNWGKDGAEEGTDWEDARRDLLRNLPSIRTRAALHIARYSIEVNPLPLMDTLEREIAMCRETRSARAFGSERPSTALQRALAFALGGLRHAESAPLLVERIQIARNAEREEMKAEVKSCLTDRDSVAACISALGDIGDTDGTDDPSRPARIRDMASFALRESLDPRIESAANVRVQAAYALARMADPAAIKPVLALLQDRAWQLSDAKEGKPSPTGPIIVTTRVAATECIGMFHARSLMTHADAVAQLDKIMKDNGQPSAVKDAAQRVMRHITNSR